MYTELYHYGIPGMKWGVRRDSKKWNKGYSEDQRKRDLKVYGRGGVRRINKSMNRYGDSISGARSAEANRINRARKAARISGQVGSVLGSIGGFVLGNKFSKKSGQDPYVSWTISGGMATVGTQLGRYGGQSLAMLVSGYSPDKFR